LVDFNLSFDRLESGGDGTGVFGGTLAYMPPEQIQALHPIEQGRVDDVGPRADVYSLAVTMFELLTGRLPFGAPKPGTDCLAALLSQLAKRYTGVPSVRLYNPRVPTDLAALLAKCLDPIPHQRYDTAAQLAEDLELFLQDRPLRHISMIPLHARAHKFVRRNRRRLMAGTATVAAACIVSLFVAHSYVKADRERRARERTEILATQLQTTADKEADEALSRRLKDPDDGRNFYRSFLMGREFFMARQYGVATRCFEKSIELRPDYAPSYFYRGRCFANLDKDADALADYSTSIVLDPNYIYSYLARAVCYATSETHADPKKALIDVETAGELMQRGVEDPNKAIYLEIARVFSAVSAKLPEAEDRERVLQRAEENFLKALDLGLEVSYVKGLHDRFHMLDPVLNRLHIQRVLAEREKK
jgi:tetratricopeptide (TPR) repeat protein